MTDKINYIFENYMTQPKISLLMPVFNSFSYLRSNGKNILPLALNSLLRQSFTDFELIILDNQSTDDTQNLCLKYAERDPRIRYIVDDRNRFPEEAIGKLAEYARAKYCAIVNDDDLWDQDYFEKLITYGEKNPDIDLVYGKLYLIDINNKIIAAPHANTASEYHKNLSIIQSLARFITRRNVIPISFGLFKTESFRNILPYEDFDTLKQNVDNLLIVKFFLRGHKAQQLPNAGFFYRQKDRKMDTLKYAKDFPPLDQPMGIWIIFLRHQMLFMNKLIEKFSEIKIDAAANDALSYLAFCTCYRVSIDILSGIQLEIVDAGLADGENVALCLHHLTSNEEGSIHDQLHKLSPLIGGVEDQILLASRLRLLTIDCINRIFHVLNHIKSIENNSDLSEYSLFIQNIVHKQFGEVENRKDLSLLAFNDSPVTYKGTYIVRKIRRILRGLKLFQLRFSNKWRLKYVQ